MSGKTDEEIDAMIKAARRKRDIFYYFERTDDKKRKHKKATADNPIMANSSLHQEICDSPGVSETPSPDQDEDPEYVQEICDSPGMSETPTPDQDKDSKCMHITVNLSEERRYAYLLAASSGVVWTKYVIGLAKLKTNGSLNNKSYVGIVKMNGLLYCSCSFDHLEQAMTAMDLGFKPHPPVSCIHLTALLLFESVTDILHEWVYPEDRESFDHDYAGDSKISIQAIDISDEGKLVYYDKRFATVSHGRCDCISHRTPCPFVKLVDSVADEWTDTVKWRQTSLSWLKVPFLSSSAAGATDMSPLMPDCCKCGSRDIVLSDSGENVPFFTIEGESFLCVHSGTCATCSSTVYPDGSSKGIFNMGNYLVSHRLLRDYAKNFVTTGMPLFTYHKLCLWNCSLDHQEGISYQKLRLAWLAFQQNVDYGADQCSNFVCPSCSAIPSVVVCDGITLSFQKRYLTALKEMVDDNATVLNGSRYEERVMLKSTDLRKKLKAEFGFDEHLIHQVQQEEPWLYPIFHHIKGLRLADIPKPWQMLIRDVTSNTPAIGLIDQNGGVDAIELLNSVLSDGIQCAEILTSLSNCVPMVYAVVRECSDCLPLLKPVISQLICKVSYVIDFHPHGLSPPEDLLRDENIIDTFPALPNINRRGTFAMDKHKTRICKKKAPSHTTLTPGIFTVTCVHGVCYGFAAMDSYESPNVPFTIIRTRFETAPQVIIYDNCCNLHDYCLNRDPGFFKHTKFFVDRFHWYNHKDCSSGYNIRNYPKYKHLNSQVAEQVNAKLALLRSIVSYCNEENFKISVLFYLWFSNCINILKLRPPANAVENDILKISGLFTRKV